MWGETKQAASSKTALTYLTIGALTVVWTAIYYIKLSRSGAEASENAFLWVYGFFFTGLVLIGIGLMVGAIGRSAMRAEVAATPSVAVVSAQPAAPAPTAHPEVVANPALNPVANTVPRTPARAAQAV